MSRAAVTNLRVCAPSVAPAACNNAVARGQASMATRRLADDGGWEAPHQLLPTGMQPGSATTGLTCR